MLAVDTNVVVRYIAADHREQSERARALIDGANVFIPLSVLLETEWVLRSIYDRNAHQITAAFRTLAGQPTVTMDQPALVAKALDWADSGIDLADALHLAAAEGCDAFITFDRKLAKSANGVAAIRVRAP